MASYRFLSSIEVLPSAEEMKQLEQASEWILAAVRLACVAQQEKATAVIGGSYAKGTLTKSKVYDIDVFLRCHEEPHRVLEKVLPTLREVSERHGMTLMHLHGSREYLRLWYSPMIVFEIVPVMHLRQGKQVENVTDLSYAHVAWVRKKLLRKRALVKEIALAKLFCKAQRVYGAESYVQGFSGYALECLVIQHGSFMHMLRSLVRVKKGERAVLDPARHYRTARQALLSLNESKTRSPIVLVDPTWKERNVLAALSEESLARFQKAGQAFLKKPDAAFFEQKEVNGEELSLLARRKKAELVTVLLETQKQAGDIAGTKLKKFAELLGVQIAYRYRVIGKEFSYQGGHEAVAYFLVKGEKQLMQKGPPISMKVHARRFREQHANSIVKKNVLYAPLHRETSATAYLRKFVEQYAPMVKQMDISWVKVV